MNVGTVSSSISVTELQELANTYLSNGNSIKKPSPQTLALYTQILQNGVIVAYFQNVKGTEVLARLFSTFSGVSCLVSWLQQTSNRLEVEAIIVLLESICDNPSLVVDNIEISGAKPLFFGSRLLFTVSSKLGNIRTRVFTPEQYSKWLVAQMHSLNDPSLLNNALKLGCPEVVLKTYMTIDIEKCGSLFNKMTRSEQLYAIPFLFRCLSLNIPEASQELDIMGVNLEYLFVSAVRNSSTVKDLRCLVLYARIHNQLHALTKMAFAKWEKNSTATLIEQQTVTQILVGCAAAMDPSDAMKYTSSIEMVEGVSNRLSITSNEIRTLGTLVAEIYAKQSGQKLDFEEQYSGYDWFVGVDSLPDKPLSRDTSKLQSVIEFRTSVKNDSNITEEKDSDSDDEYDSDDEDNVTVDPPVYVKDLVSYLLKGEYAECRAALTYGPSLILHKARFGSEVGQYAEDVLRLTCTLADKYNIPQFAERRQALLNSVLIADPNQVEVVVKLFSTGDWSLSQRLSLLAAIAGASEALSRNGSTSSTRENTGKDEFTKLIAPQLPLTQHLLFTSGSKDPVALPAVNSTAGTTNELSLENRSIPQVPYSKLCKQFFFPLFSSPPKVGAGAYDSLVYSQWLRTLGFILYKSYPSNYIQDMVIELWPLCLAQMSQVIPDLVREALALCVLAMTAVASGVLVRNFASQIGIFVDLLGQACDRTNDQNVITICRQAQNELLRLGTSMEQQLLGLEA
ncbi:Tel2 protein [Starmerella bacillaris]|uniref:Tel2 protein n=1 Tax=Starmerella bacillaris TaxID=1247836 RepID=A0AAV5RHM2_STABA|nr:Tel2 protein [Starmerella bacillaris]